jgi:hypothetical protein
LYVPVRDLDLFTRLLGTVPPVDGAPPVRLVTFAERVDKPMLSHEVALCHADEYCPAADFVFHLDSDCIFTEPVTPADYFVDGRPVLVCENFDRFYDFDPQNPGKRNALHWKAAAEVALGFPVTHECMCRHPMIHPRALYPGFRRHVEGVVKQSFDDYVLSCRDQFPQTFAEFTSLGAYARKFFADKYHWVEIPFQPRPADKLKQYWSHGGLTPDVRAEIEGILATC